MTEEVATALVAALDAKLSHPAHDARGRQPGRDVERCVAEREPDGAGASRCR